MRRARNIKTSQASASIHRPQEQSTQIDSVILTITQIYFLIFSIELCAINILGNEENEEDVEDVEEEVEKHRMQ